MNQSAHLLSIKISSSQNQNSSLLNRSFLEAITSSATFPDDNPSAFEVLMEWIYYDSLKSIGLNRNHTQEGQDNMRKIIATLGLAGKYCIDGLADRCLTILYHRSRTYNSCQLDLDTIVIRPAREGLSYGSLLHGVYYCRVA